jgi:hypothetical protein
MSLQLLLTLARQYPMILLIPVLNVPLVNSVVLPIGLNVIFRLPKALIDSTRYCVNKLSSKGSDGRVVVEDLQDGEKQFAIFTDIDSADWEHVELL